MAYISARAQFSDSQHRESTVHMFSIILFYYTSAFICLPWSMYIAFCTSDIDNPRIPFFMIHMCFCIFLCSPLLCLIKQVAVIASCEVYVCWVC